MRKMMGKWEGFASDHRFTAARHAASVLQDASWSIPSVCSTLKPGAAMIGSSSAYSRSL